MCRQIVYAARSIGMKTAGIGGVVYSLPYFEDINGEHVYDRLATLLGNIIRMQRISKSSSSSSSSNEKSNSQLTIPSSEYQIEYELRESSQGNETHINKMISGLGNIKAEFALVVYDPFFELIAEQMEDILTVDLADIGDFCPIYTGTFHGQKVFLIHQNRYYFQGFEFYEVYSSIRVNN